MKMEKTKPMNQLSTDMNKNQNTAKTLPDHEFQALLQQQLKKSNVSQALKDLS